MTITDTQCTSFVIASTWFQDLIDDSPSPGYTLNLTILLDDTEVLNEDLEAADVVGAIYTYATTDGGYYNITITKTDNTTGSEYEDIGCIWWDCDDVLCDLIDYLGTSEVETDAVIQMYYNTLLSIKDCANCSCANARLVWTKMNNIISGNTTTNDCGCD